MTGVQTCALPISLFLRSNEAATLYAIMNAPIPPPSELRPEVPPQLDKIVARALARLPEDRFETAEEMATALDDFLTQTPRYDARVLAGQLEELFGSTRAEAKRSIAQTRALTRNISLVMKLRSEIRAELAERLDAAVVSVDDAGRADTEDPSLIARGSGIPIQAVGPSRSQRGVVIALAALLVGALAAGVAYIVSRSDQSAVAKQAAVSALQIDSTPPGAAVFVGGEPTGLKTPTTLTGITKKQLAIRLELAGHAPVAATVDVPTGGTAQTKLTLARLQGRLVISELPANASVILDNQEYEAGELIPVAAGKHDVRIVLAGKTLAQQSIETASGDQVWKLVHGALVQN